MNITIPSPTGTLDARYDPAPQSSGTGAIVCHPHPQYGGSMHDGVVECVADVLQNAGVGVLRFNFRGVGASTGRYDGGPGEVEDLLAAAAWLRAEEPNDALWVGGYSFGAYVAWQALLQNLQTDRVLLVAPPVGPMAFPPVQASCPIDVFVGDGDAFVDPRALGALPGTTVHTITGADHFFAGHFDDLAERLRNAIA